MSALLGIISYLSYQDGSDSTMRLAASVLLIYTALTPVMSFISDGKGGKIDAIFESDIGQNFDGGEEYIEVAEDAFKDGISKLIFTKYGVNEEDSEIFVFGFDFEKMRAERICVVLRGVGALSDLRGIESYINGLGLGKCEVTVSFE